MLDWRQPSNPQAPGKSCRCLTGSVENAGYEDGQEEKEKQEKEAGRARLLTIPELLDHMGERAKAAASELAKDTKAQASSCFPPLFISAWHGGLWVQGCQV